MLPIDMLPKVVRFQRNDNNPLVPPANDRIATAKALIQQRVDRLERIKNEVLAQLAENAKEVEDALTNFVNLLAADDPNRAIQPQLENLTQSLADIQKIKDKNLRALQSDNEQIAKRTKQCGTLNTTLSGLQYQLDHPVDSQGMSFAKEFGSKVALFAANKGK